MGLAFSKGVVETSRSLAAGATFSRPWGYIDGYAQSWRVTEDHSGARLASRRGWGFSSIAGNLTPILTERYPLPNLACRVLVAADPRDQAGGCQCYDDPPGGHRDPVRME